MTAGPVVYTPLDLHEHRQGSRSGKADQVLKPRATAVVHWCHCIHRHKFAEYSKVWELLKATFTNTDISLAAVLVYRFSLGRCLCEGKHYPSP